MVSIEKKCDFLPKRIILVRHGESLVNEDESVLQHIPNHKIKLSQTGRSQARITASKILDMIISPGGSSLLLFYVSPSSRTRETAQEIASRVVPKERVVGVREECRLREQHFGNFQDLEERRKIKSTRNTYGKFFYRVPQGESSFIEGLWRDMEVNKLKCDEELNLVVVSHGLTILLFLMKWFNWTVNEFEALANPSNCECRVLELGHNGEYSLAIHHKPEELKQWGLSQEMIHDQMIRASKFYESY
ncbi:phosphoglycerate/bisphosphoglycerate mutasefamily protein [Striga asiatica]|uniref:Phosphoglycerate/bisphosphoglycerate mutasefamily protein n=1 Tax=Striga asiatica TaxID=4170 RepID=A0A5A7R4G4_STRAF|nr:phosphoglycerate/bisphosphoglycerate mutasefamily protein [Striga asiatica]